MAEVAASVLKFMTDQPATGDTKKNNEAYLAEMQALRKQAGNALLISQNLVNSRIMLFIAKVAWTEQSMSTPEQDRDLLMRYAIGTGEKVLKRMWRQAVFDGRHGRLLRAHLS